MVKVSSFIDEARAAMRYRRPAIAVLQSFGEPSGPAGAMPSAEELRCMTFLSVVHEARGVIYFFVQLQWSNARNPPTTLGLGKRRVPGKFASSVPRCSRHLRANFRCHRCPLRGQVHSRIIQYDGNVYMIAVNTLRSPINNVRWTINGLSDGPFEVLWEDRNLTVQKGMLMDDFAPLEVHFYRRRQ